MRDARDRAARIVLTLAVLLGFALQSYVTQTHIHLPGGDGIYAGASADTVTKGSPAHHGDKRSPKDDPANCPLCQQILIAGAFVAPPTVALILPMEMAFAAPPALSARRHSKSPSHSWHSRAPPAA